MAWLKRLFVLGDLEAEYRMERDRLRSQLLALTPPMMPDLEWAAEILQDFGQIWEAATPKERRQIVHTLLETVYLDVDRGPVVAIEPKAEFAPLFEMMDPGKAESDSSAGDIIILPPGAEISRRQGLDMKDRHGLHQFVSSVPSLDCSSGQSVFPFW